MDGSGRLLTFGLRRAAIALAKENNGLDDGLYHSPLQGCGIPDLGNAETAQAQLNRRIVHANGGGSGVGVVAHAGSVLKIYLKVDPNSKSIYIN
jgi:hypothetical protein